MDDMAAVIFDCDGVLVDSEIVAVRAKLRTLKELGLTFNEAEYIHRQNIQKDMRKI